MINLSEARQTEFPVGKSYRRAYLCEALSDAPLPVEASSDCIASIDEDSSLVTLFPAEATAALRGFQSLLKPNSDRWDCSRPILPPKYCTVLWLSDFVPAGLNDRSQAIYCLVSAQKGEPSRRERYD
jgi:hypothetical protein